VVAVDLVCPTAFFLRGEGACGCAGTTVRWWMLIGTGWGLGGQNKEGRGSGRFCDGGLFACGWAFEAGLFASFFPLVLSSLFN